jgi:SAM-dependent methyltransferase
MSEVALGVNENSDVYYTGTYWNDFAIVREKINASISGDPHVPWHEHFATATGRKFRRALILNCGNGWVERELVETGLIAEGVGIDYSQALLDEADEAAKRSGLALSYRQGNVNTDDFPEGEFDLVVNHAAAHHITAIDRVFRQVCRVLPDDGWFVSFDYVGPHRNQYGLDAWEEAWRVNQRLPEPVRQRMEYPPIPVMLVVDPTEAVHSELIMPTFDRYFAASQLTPLGGAIAYPLLTHNARMFEAQDGPERDSWIGEVLAADDRYLSDHPDSALFAYFAGTPKKEVLEQAGLLAQWESEERARERHAEQHGGEYYPRGPLASTLVALAEQRTHNAAAQARAEQLEGQLDAMRSRFVYAHARRLAESKWVGAARRGRLGSGLERRLRRRLEQ